MTTTEVRRFRAHSGRAWVAAITGRDPKFGLARLFLAKRDETRSGNTYREIEIAVLLVEGALYEWREQASARRSDGGYWLVRAGALIEIDRQVVEDALSERAA